MTVKELQPNETESDKKQQIQQRQQYKKELECCHLVLGQMCKENDFCMWCHTSVLTHCECKLLIVQLKIKKKQ